MEFIKNTLNQVELNVDTLYDIFYNMFFFVMLKESEEDIKKGRVMTIEESKERLMQEYEYLDI